MISSNLLHKTRLTRLLISNTRANAEALIVLRRSFAASPRKERARAARRERQTLKQTSQQNLPVYPKSNEYAPVPQQQLPPVRYEAARPLQAPPTFAQTMITYAGLGAGLTLGMTVVAVAFRAIGF